MSLQWVGQGKGYSQYPVEPELGEDVKRLLRSAWVACLGPLEEEGWRATKTIHLMAGRIHKVKVKVKDTVASAENQPAS